MTESSPESIPQQKEDTFANKVNNLSYVGNWFTIIGTCISLILGIWSLILTVQVGKSSVRIEKMDSVIQLLSKHGISQDKEIAALTDLQNLSIKILDRNTLQLSATKQQTSYMEMSEQPQIQVVNYAVDSINPLRVFRNYNLQKLWTTCCYRFKM